MSALTTRDALAKALQEHRERRETSGLICECWCGEWKLDRTLREWAQPPFVRAVQEWSAHVAAALPVTDAATLADELVGIAADAVRSAYADDLETASASLTRIAWTVRKKADALRALAAAITERGAR